VTPDPEQQLQALFAAGDPAARVDERMTQRVAARLAERPHSTWHLGWARAVTVGLVLVSSAGLGAAAVFVAKKELAPAKAPAPVTVTTAKAPLAPRPPDPVALEAQLVREALEALQRGDLELAGARLDQRQEQFPDGLLQAEADAVRARCGR